MFHRHRTQYLCLVSQVFFCARFYDRMTRRAALKGKHLDRVKGKRVDGTGSRGLAGRNGVKKTGWRRRGRRRSEGNGWKQRGGRDRVEGTGWCSRWEGEPRSNEAGGELHEAERRRLFTGGMLLLPTNAQSAGFLATLD